MAFRIFFTTVLLGLLYGVHGVAHTLVLPEDNYKNNLVQADLEKPNSPKFSPEPGWYSSSLEVMISTSDEDGMILYTLDGSEPCLENVNGGESYLVNYYHHHEWENSQNIPRANVTYIYSGPIAVSERTSADNDLADIITTYDTSFDIYWKKPEEKIFKGQVIKAKTIREGTGSETVTATYLVNEQKNNRFHLPVLSVTTDPENLFGFEKGIYVQGKTFFDSGGSVTNYVNHANFGNRGREWERPVHVELFGNDGKLEFSQNLGMRIHGGTSRSRPMKGFRLYARNDYDDNNSMQHRFLPEAKDIYGAIMGDHKHILVRMGGDLMNIFTDAASHRIMAAANLDIQWSTPIVHLFNGEYWGVANIRNRLNDHYLARKYYTDTDNLIILDSPWGQGSSENVEAGNPGEISLYRDIYNHVVNQDMSDPKNYAEFEEKVDVLSYIDYNIMFIYLNNVDWYGEKHFKYWRVREVSNNPYQDGKWRFMVWDFDTAARFGGPGFDMLVNFIHPDGGGNEYASGNPQKTALLRNLLESSEFKELFINRFADHINTTFKPERMEPILRDTYERVRPALEEHRLRWRYQWATEEILNIYFDFTHKRPAHQFQQLRDHFGLSETVQVSIETANKEAGTLQINTLPISRDTPGVGQDPYPWTGTYFKEIPIKLQAHPNPGFEIDHWLVNGARMDEEVLEVTPKADMAIQAVFREAEFNEPRLIHFWLFDTNIPNNTPLTQLFPQHNSLPIVPMAELLFHPAATPPSEGEGTEGIMDRVNDPTIINYREQVIPGVPFEDIDMRGIRVRNPLRTLENGEVKNGMLELRIPTNLHRSIQVSMAVSRTNNGPEMMRWEYRTTEDGEWTKGDLKESQINLTTSFQMVTIDFSEIEEVNDNLHFALRFIFEGNTVTGDSGNARFNNIAVEGVEFKEEVITSLPRADREHRRIVSKLYPNPTYGQLHLDLHQEQWPMINGLEIVNSQGVIINSFDSVPDRSFSISLENVPAGVYSIRVTSPQNSEVLRFIKK
ncbi:CotH kinase family protein [Pleomorphovibrio marinus]|uniref:CotH kinase family protein n=1 Tax=Pleomorphovibrio marinus TaxID=2164132 RepID=UPI0018E58581|nr:CotH kinase family protein [Pleomorphovibrio marinus]